MKKLLMVMLATISISGFAIEAPKKDYEEYYKIFENAKIQNISNAEIEKKLEECAIKGNTYCSLVTGIFYFRKNDYTNAFKYLSNADYEFKDPDGKLYWGSSFYLGTLYFGGLGTTADNEKAIEQYKHCAQMGKSFCALMLSGVYDVSLRNNPVPAYAWMLVAKKNGHG